jgi:drug/metabolite transporter (DMT)-like permease
MQQSNRSLTYGWAGALLLMFGICSMCGGGIQGFGDRDPNPSPETRTQFQEIDRRIGWMFTGGLILVFSGAICIAVAVTRNKRHL